MNQRVVPYQQQNVLPRPGLSGLAGMLAVGSVAAVSLASGEWIFGLAIAVLLIGWRVLGRGENPPVVAAAFTYQWAQVTIALFYFFVTGRKIADMEAIDYRPMVLIGLASVTAMFAGYYIAAPRIKNRNRSTVTDQARLGSLASVAIVYAATVAASGAVQGLAWSFPGLTQVIIAVSYTRFVFLYLLVSRLLDPKPRRLWLLAVLCAELALGFTGVFADFREPLAMITLAVIGSTHTRRAVKWSAFVALLGVAFGAGVIWTAIKPLVRESYSYSASTTKRLGTAARMITPALTKTGGRWEPQVDRLVARMWTVYYPALALERVPKIVPHAKGAILRGAIQNIVTPRLFFPGKGILASTSDNVRKYSGVWVAGRETNTSYAFGYAAESYVDFGFPMMLIPIFLFGCVVGLADRVILSRIPNEEIRTGIRVLVLWMSLYQFEVAWVIMIGVFLTLLGVMGIGTLLIEKFIHRSAYRARISSQPRLRRDRIAIPGR